MSDLLKPEQRKRPDDERDWNETFRHAKSLFAVVLSLVVLIGGGLFAYNKVGTAVTGLFVAEDYPGPGEDDVEVEIPQGSTVDEIGSILKDADVVASTDAFSRAAAEIPNANQLQAGTYTLQTKMRARDAIQAMLDAGVKGGKRFLIREGLRINEQVAALAEQTGIPAERFEEALKNPDAYGLPSWAKGNPEGYLFPDTYEMSGEDPNTALKQMTANFMRKANDVQLEARAGELNREPGDLVTIASIIEAEVRRPEDRAKVARVIYNRLDAKPSMPLQMDSTVHYAVNHPRTGGVTTTDADRANPSPYNTYVHAGIPPGPIGAPGRSALEAAANPADGDWKYFVSVNMDTGETAFAETFAEHEQNVRKFRAWCQDNPGKC
ncbi:endolytic transglycosylase MltG [Granulicoccus sp. GXG6511]|uniref:endolytic transglycosylase MltG n=1 Tax=Granulicoccus sp. GXG6511 TaxID=3381351 RepID=UPI003D7C830F